MGEQVTYYYGDVNAIDGLELARIRLEAERGYAEAQYALGLVLARRDGNQGTDRMLDIIYNTVVNGFEKMIEDNVSSNDRFNVIMKNGNCEVTSAELAERYQSAVSAKQAVLNNLLRTWYTLPKVEKSSE